uniref:Zinc finger GRF-type domain-containing protein n=1 Tax=Setaria viridis TaxID=4556 RepID=A0A4V6D9Y7_SETVI|nr:hypothetical protein SEVIR_3G287600v2 [Setaria viridis]
MRRSSSQLPQVLGVTDSYRSSSPKNKCKHKLPFYVRYNWTFDNPGRRYSCCCKCWMKCMSFRWVDPEWDARTKGNLVKLMKRKEKAKEETRSWEEAWRLAKMEANDKIYEIHMMKRGYFGDTTNELMNTAKRNRHDEECAKANKEIEATAAELQKVKGHLDQATNMVKKVKQSLLQASYRRSFRDDGEA